MRDFRSLSVWEKAHDLVLSTYEVTRSFPGDERYGLTSQLRRSATSIASNIAEGCGRGSDADFARCLQIAFGSASEVEYQLLLAKDLGLLDAGTYGRLSSGGAEVKRMLAALIKKLTAGR
jgi:four helix bundle protein